MCASPREHLDAVVRHAAARLHVNGHERPQGHNIAEPRVVHPLGVADGDVGQATQAAEVLEAVATQAGGLADEFFESREAGELAEPPIRDLRGKEG